MLERNVTTRRMMSPLAVVLVCLCAIAFAPIPQIASLVCAESVEFEPCSQDSESFEEALLASPPLRRSVNDRRQRALDPSSTTNENRLSTGTQTVRFRAIVGHQFVNGLRAPMLI